MGPHNGRLVTLLDITSHLSLASPCCVAGLVEPFPLLPVCGPFLPDLPGFHVPSVLPTMSFHLNWGPPLGCFQSISISATALMFSVSSLLFTCPNHSNLLLLITITIGSTFASYKISSFLRCSSRLTHIALIPSSSLLLPFAFHLLLTLAMFRSRKARVIRITV